MSFERTLANVASDYPNPEGKFFSYGTAGFRDKGEDLVGVAFRMGIYAVLLSRKEGKATGVMVTASHLPPQDNGFRLIDASGSMLPQAWERNAELLANAASAGDIAKAMATAASEFGPEARGTATVLVGKDTRATGPRLVAAVRAGVWVAGGQVVDHGLLTTPQLHWLVRQTNERREEVGLPEYYRYITAAFTELNEGQPVGNVVVDCANGIGTQGMKGILEGLGEAGKGIELRNTDVETVAKLNWIVGAEWIQTGEDFPLGFIPYPAKAHLAALDGDADRLVYFDPDGPEGTGDGAHWDLKGDRIAVLLGALIVSLLEKTTGLAAPPKVGVVQTACASRASTEYIRTLGLGIACTPTGTKYMHRKAEEYDIGIYFEENGHGSVLFKSKTVEQLQKASGEGAKRLIALSKLASPACGDAIANLLLCEAALRELGWSIQDWIARYEDKDQYMRPFLVMRQLSVPDPKRIRTAWDERRVTEPAGLQEGIDYRVALHNASTPGASRAFVRPSGTEPVVRVYAESDTYWNALGLAKEVEGVVQKVLEANSAEIPAKRRRFWFF